MKPDDDASVVAIVSLGGVPGGVCAGELSGVPVGENACSPFGDEMTLGVRLHTSECGAEDHLSRLSVLPPMIFFSLRSLARPRLDAKLLEE